MLAQFCILKYQIVTKNALTEVSFGTVTIQRSRRIALDANLLRTLGIAEGDSIEVVLLVDSSEIILRRADDAGHKASPLMGDAS